MRLRSAVVLASSAAMLLTGLPSAQANHSWGGYHWARTSNPFTLALGSNVDGPWPSYLAHASSDWSTSSVLDTVVQAGLTTGRKCRGTKGTVQVCNASYGNNGWLGLATVWLTGGVHITQGTVKLNDFYFSTPTYNNANERQHVMCQEIGHTFGLDHQSTDGSVLNTCMDYSTSPTSTAPNQHDYDELQTIYAHTDGFSTVGSTTTGSNPAVGEDRASWGREVYRSPEGSESVFVRDFEDGARAATFVAWAAR